VSTIRVPGGNLMVGLVAWEERLWKGIESEILKQHKSSLFPSAQPCSAGNHKK